MQCIASSVGEGAGRNCIVMTSNAQSASANNAIKDAPCFQVHHQITEFAGLLVVRGVNCFADELVRSLYSSKCLVIVSFDTDIGACICRISYWSNSSQADSAYCCAKCQIIFPFH